MNVCLYYHPEAYSTRGPKLMGRHAAGESFLRGFLRHGRADTFWLQVQHRNHARHFAASAQAHGRGEPVRVVDTASLPLLAQAGTVFHPGPGLGEPAWQRAALGATPVKSPTHHGWSLCGITHTTSSAVAMDAIAALITAPVQPWDALICTSAAVKQNVERVLQAQTEHLRVRLDIRKRVLPQLPVIPLGIHTDDFVFTAGQRAEARAQLGIPADTVVVLFMGRLSFHAKAHPLAMYQALARAVHDTGKPVVLIECGWHANDFIADAYAEAARTACPDVPVHTLDGRDPAKRAAAWATADIACSLSDNIQETFGIVPIEAMAAGLPVVVSDWDGYRDTVRDGIDGFRVPTLMPGAGLGADLALRHATGLDRYDHYCGYTASLVAVDVGATARAFVTLIRDADLRRRMGEAGRERARAVYDWSVIIRQYEALWAELNQRRAADAAASRSAQQPSPPVPAWPARLDPFQAFAAYPSHTLRPDTRLTLAHDNADAARARLDQLKSLAMVRYARAILPNDAELATVLDAAEAGPQPAARLIDGIAPARRSAVFRALAWLVKLDILRLAP